MHEGVACIREGKCIGVGSLCIRKHYNEDRRSGQGFVDSTGSFGAGLSVSAMLREASVAGSWFGG